MFSVKTVKTYKKNMQSKMQNLKAILVYRNTTYYPIFGKVEKMRLHRMNAYKTCQALKL